MKLTNMIRDAFVSAAMADVPKVDYAEQARSLGNKTLRELQEKAFPGIDLTIAEGWFHKCSVDMPGALQNLYAVSTSRYALKEMSKVWAKLESLDAAHREQSVKLDNLRTKLRAVAYSCTTRKALVELLPEFEKYLPADTPTAVRTLPAIANVVAEFAQAGWPAKKGGAK